MATASKAWLCTTVLAAALLAHAAAHAADTVPCQTLPGTALKHVEVFDGPPEELASLMPDDDSKNTSRFTLGDIYDAGRFVTIRCEYANGKTADVKLPAKIEACTYAIGQDKKVSFTCR